MAAPTSVDVIEEPRRRDGPLVVRLRTSPSMAVLTLFTQSFPRHPISRLPTEFGASFLEDYARDSVFLVACDETGEDVGFLIGGSTQALDQTRLRFIRRHALRIAAASANDRSLRKLLLPRLRPARTVRGARFAGMQLRFVAVAPRVRGSGAGAALVNAFEETLRGEDGYHTWTMAGANGAEGFFVRMGFERDSAVGEHLRLCKPLG